MSTKNRVTVNDIFIKYYRDYYEKYRGHISHQQSRVINALISCKTINLGGHLYKCDSCNKDYIVSVMMKGEDIDNCRYSYRL